MSMVKKNIKPVYVFMAVLFVVLAFGVFSEEQPKELVYRQDKLSIVTADGKSHDFRIEVADTPETMAHGLMFRRQMDKDAGMIFLEPEEMEIRMWMKNTYLPLDMVFIDKTGTVSHVFKNAVPMSTTVISSVKPASAVLEVLGGLTDELKIAEGDKVKYPYFEGR